MAATQKIPREWLIVGVLGYGSALLTLGGMAMYDLPGPRSTAVTLTARAATQPKMALAQAATLKPKAQSASAPAASVASETAVPTAARDTAAASPAPTAVSETVPVVRVASAEKMKPAKPSRYEVRKSREYVAGGWVEYEDYRYGLKYTGDVHDFAAGTVPKNLEKSARKKAGE